MKENTLAIIPAYNESRYLSATIKQTLPFMPVLVVNDGSTDNTPQIAQQAGAKLIHNPTNLGKGAALKKGFQYAIKHDYKTVITLDGDGQHDPREIPLFLEKYASTGAKLIIGKRDFSQMPFVRRLANQTGSYFLNAVHPQHIPDNQSGYRLLTKPVMELVLQSQESGFEFEVEMILLSLEHNILIDWVPIKTIYLSGDSKIKPVQHTKNYIRILWKVYRSNM